FSATRVPAAVPLSPERARLLALYDRAAFAHRAGAGAMAAVFPAVRAALDRDHPSEWLLRWNLLESCLKSRVDPGLAAALRADLERLEVAHGHLQPIASGLRYLERLAA
ncbi:MAG: hypothetical protein FWD17_17540, partial [Polyangiaceae bacterium]|nr:hypothetical protein [Polyangiaceae bacterium]